MQEVIAERLQMAVPRVAEELQSLARESIHVRTNPAPDEQPGIGASRLGGLPDLPPSITWPEWNGIALTFITQVRMDDVAAYDPENLLPKSGILYFFYAADEQRGGHLPEDSGSGRVFYFDGEMSNLRRRTPPVNLPEAMGQFNPCALSFELETTLPGLHWGLLEKVPMDESERKSYWNLLQDLRRLRWDKPGWYCHRLLGHADEEQGDLQLDCEIVISGLRAYDGAPYKDPIIKARAQDWLLLLQVCSDEQRAGMMWGDAGFIYFMIRKDDLAARKFDNIWVILQCT